MEWGPEFEDLLHKEKQLRQSEEVLAAESEAVLCEILQRLRDRQNWDGVCEAVQVLAKRRRQSKQAIVGMLRKAMEFLDELPPDSKLLHILREVTEGKIFLEVEYARLTKRLALFKENSGKLDEASALLQDVQVETYGSMEKEEKLDFLLEQLRVLLLQNDFVRFHIISKKVNRKVLDEESMRDKKVKFLEFMIRYYDHEKDYFEEALAFKTIHETTQAAEALDLMVLHLLLVQHNAEQIDLLRSTSTSPFLQPDLLHVLKILLGAEIGRLPQTLYGFVNDQDKWKLLNRRVNQHNIRIIQKYYSRISLRRLAEILEMSLDETESELRDMVSYMAFSCKINRPDGFVMFNKTAGPHSELNSWSSDIFTLLQKVEEIHHLINREHIKS
jgi:26S proteasome regulatory subunit N5